MAQQQQRQGCQVCGTKTNLRVGRAVGLKLGLPPPAADQLQVGRSQASPGRQPVGRRSVGGVELRDVLGGLRSGAR